MNVMECVSQGLFYLDGGTGTTLQKRGLLPGELPESWNLNHPEEIVNLHRAYYEAGSHAVCTNTFGANGLKFDGKNGNPSVRQIVHAAVACAKKAKNEAVGGQKERYVALDIGPLGHLLKPLGDVAFETAVELFAEVVRAGVEVGVDFVLIETMNDCYETKAAVLAAKENSNLPIFASNVYDVHGKTLSGTTPEAMVSLLEGLGVNVIGINCSMGPAQMLELVPRLRACASVPLLVKPNAGLPRAERDGVVYDVSPAAFASTMKKIVDAGAGVIGGCCGTTADYIKALADETKGMSAISPAAPSFSVVSSHTHALKFGDFPIIIGERINPTGRDDLKSALRSGDFNLILKEGLRQEQYGSHVLDVNVGLPEIDEPSLLESCIQELQKISGLPLQIDTANPVAMERAMRIYNGKPMINSVNGNPESMDAVFPLIQKYGGLAVCLTLDQNGIPDTAQGRFKVAQKIFCRAAEYGLAPSNLIFDPLALTISSDNQSANIAMDTVSFIHQHLKCLCCLGISNISFGLPERDRINAAFFMMALTNGLDAAIVNPYSSEIQKVYRSYMALSGLDANCLEYIKYARDWTEPEDDKRKSRILKNIQSENKDVQEAIVAGLCTQAAESAAHALETMEPLLLINGQIIPALDEVGRSFESGEAFLPQLLMSADAAKAAFVEVKKRIPASTQAGPSIVLATVKGDIHDIGKNIVRALLENYGYHVIDLGRDVSAERIAEAVMCDDVKLVGLSALMTTTAPAMKETIELLREKNPGCRIVIGGAVITQAYADQIGADYYAKNAMETVRYAQVALKSK